MNAVAKQTAAGIAASLDLGLFHDAVLQSEFAVYVIRFDDDGVARFEEANGTVVALAGRPLAQIVGQRPIDCLPLEIGNCLEDKLAMCLSTGEPLIYERSAEGLTGMMAFR